MDLAELIERLRDRFTFSMCAVANFADLQHKNARVCSGGLWSVVVACGSDFAHKINSTHCKQHPSNMRVKCLDAVAHHYFENSEPMPLCIEMLRTQC